MLLLEQTYKLDVVRWLLLAIDGVVNGNRGVELEVFARETVKSQVTQILRGELEVSLVHGQKLVHTVQEKYEKWSVIFAIIDVRPRRHLKPLCFQVRRHCRYCLTVKSFSV